jgi:hypothetical protein
MLEKIKIKNEYKEILKPYSVSMVNYYMATYIISQDIYFEDLIKDKPNTEDVFIKELYPYSEILCKAWAKALSTGAEPPKKFTHDVTQIYAPERLLELSEKNDQLIDLDQWEKEAYRLVANWFGIKQEKIRFRIFPDGSVIPEEEFEEYDNNPQPYDDYEQVSIPQAVVDYLTEEL